MAQANVTSPFPGYFILVGFPGLEDLYLYLACFFTVLYVVSTTGNLTLLSIIKIDRSLHEPMYIFLFMLSTTDLLLSTFLTPKILEILWVRRHETSYEACLTQLFLIHSFATTESFILVAMAFDRYVAICHPLRYFSIITKGVIIKIAVCGVIRTEAIMVPIMYLLKKLPFCSNNIIHHSYCEHMAVVKLACADTSINNIYGIIVMLVTSLLDLFFITSSYVLILRAVLRLGSRDARLKTLSTCTSHICVMLAFYVPAILSSIVYRVLTNVPLHIHILLANVYLILPPLINPIVYGVKTKQVRRRLLFIFKL
ncbi:olfactory receptor 52K1-like [Hyperolius riggenbachi]|uniref:olfactory receptor 52K1-like n=1 Tax=Hyperolius riggenbachi TaxID=752182 RepID=UPI0035A31BBF